MAKENPQPRRRKSYPQSPSIALGGGGEGFSVSIIKDLYIDRPHPPPPREANDAKSFPQSKLNGVDNLSTPSCKFTDLSTPAPGEFTDLSTPPKSHPTYPQFRQHPKDVIASMRQLLKDRGIAGVNELVRQYPLEIILEAINAVDGMLAEGVEVRNPAGLIKWRLETTSAELDHQVSPFTTEEDTVSNRGILTTAERRVLALVAAGLGNKQIADKLVIGTGTVVSHIGSILSKLHASNRTDAVMIAMRRGIIDLEDVNGQSEG